MAVLVLARPRGLRPGLVPVRPPGLWLALVPVRPPALVPVRPPGLRPALPSGQGPRRGIISTVLAHMLAPVCAPAAARLSIARTTPTSGVSLTFDDGPHPEGTPAVLEVLARAGARATFFVVGEQVRRRPALLNEIVAAGHLVALHADRHRLQLRLTAAQLREDLARGVAAIGDALGTAPQLHRPPYGVYSPAGLQAARAARLRPLLWSRWGRDWRKHTTPRRIAARALRQIGNGDVILLHDSDFYSADASHRRTVVALDLIIVELNRRKLDTVLPV